MFKWLRRGEDAAAAAKGLVKTGFEQFQAGNLDGAAHDIAAASARDPRNADAHYLLGLIALRRGEIPEGLKHLDQALELEPANPYFMYSKADTLKGLDRKAEAMALLEAALAIDDTDAQWWFLLGSLLDDAGRREDALEAWRKALDRDGGNGVTWWEYGNLLRQAGQEESSAQALARVDELIDGSVEREFEMALHCQNRQQYDEARRRYHRVLAHDPDHRATLVNLGGLEVAHGDLGEARQILERTVARYPEFPEAWINLASALRRQGRHEEARAANERALALAPDSNEARMQLAITLDVMKEYASAERLLHEVIAANPSVPQPHFLLGNTLRGQGHLDEAELAFRRADSCPGGYPDALVNLSMLLIHMGRMGEAEQVLDEALRRQPESVEAYGNLGVVLMSLRRPAQAEAAFRRAIEIDSQQAGPHINLSNMLYMAGRHSEAEAEAKLALEIESDNVDALINLGATLNSQGRHAESIAAMRKVVELHPDNALAWSNLLFTLNYREDLSPLQMLEEHRAFGRQYTPAPGSGPDFSQWDRKPDRKLRIGYVSPDFRNHVVAVFFEPVLDGHDRSRFEVICYFNHNEADTTTHRIKQKADYWRDIAALTDDDVERIMLQDRLDVVVDLAGHTARNRLPVLARRVAPVQVTWLGYPNGTGLETMDWRITDGRADPAPDTDAHYAERLYRLPDTFLVYRPHAESPPVAPSPCASTGQITFGAFNNYVKITDEMLALWVRILEGVPGSRLWVKTLALGDRNVRDLAMARYREAGGDPARVELSGPTASYQDHLAGYGRVDVALDTFPYHGTTTTCESLWMGVPVVTLAGGHHAARVGVSLLTAVGLESCVARSADEYVAKAVELASDRDALATLRAGIRPRVQASALIDESRFTRELESAYRDMWRQWVRAH